MTDGPSYGFDTLQIHAGARPDPATGARQVPIYQTTAYVFRDADHAAALFNLQEVGYIYSRLTNPTLAVLQERVATLEGGAGAVACSSGHAAQIMALFPLMGPGCNVVASTRLYGGTITQFSQTIKRFGWSAKFVDTDDLGRRHPPPAQRDVHLVEFDHHVGIGQDEPLIVDDHAGADRPGHPLALVKGVDRQPGYGDHRGRHFPVELHGRAFAGIGRQFPGLHSCANPGTESTRVFGRRN